MKTWEALSRIHEDVKSILVEAGFVDGSKLNVESIKAETRTMFWHSNITSKDASDKSMYLIYNINECDSVVFLEVEAYRKATVIIGIFSRNRIVSTDIKNVNEAMLANGWSFEYLNHTYDGGNKMFLYSFECKKDFVGT